MLITRKDLGSYASDLIKTLEDNKISALEDLDRMLGRTIDIGGRKSVEFALRFSYTNRVFTLSLIEQGVGIPIEAKAHRALDCWHFMVKCQSEIYNYDYFATDTFGNKAQNKLVFGCEYKNLIDEIEYLRKL